MTQPADLFDHAAVARARMRAQRGAGPALFLQEAAALELSDRLSLVNKTFTSPAIVSAWPALWGGVVPEALLVEEHETLGLTEGAHDLVVHGLCLHWSNDPVGQLIQCRRALLPDGLFLGVLFGGQTLHELRASLAEAEAEMTGGLSPRVAPMAEIRDLGALLQRAGFALPVADSVTITVQYETLFHLMADLRAMTETNAMTARLRRPTRRGIFSRAAEIYAQNFPSNGQNTGGILATFDMIHLAGWAPSASQPQPLRPGSATTRLADALGTTETKLPQTD